MAAATVARSVATDLKAGGLGVEMRMLALAERLKRLCAMCALTDQTGRFPRHRLLRSDRRTRCVFGLSRPGPPVPNQLADSVFDFAVSSSARSSATLISRTCAPRTNRLIISGVRGSWVISSVPPRRIQMAKLAKGSCGLLPGTHHPLD